jgi:hypothetical protein
MSPNQKCAQCSAPSDGNFLCQECNRKVIESFHFFSQPISSILPKDEEFEAWLAQQTPETEKE